MTIADPVVFVDTETTGLDPDRHEIWELAIITADGSEWEWQLPVDLARADPTGLRIGRFYERRAAVVPRPTSLAGIARWRTGGSAWVSDGVTDMAQQVAVLLDGRHLVGAVPSFDAAFLGRWLRAHGQAAAWHYHLVDVEALAAGKLGVAPPWKSDDLTAGLGLEIDHEGRHTALGDARWAKAIYQAVLHSSRDGR